MTNEDLKRFYTTNQKEKKKCGFVRYDDNGNLPGVHAENSNYKGLWVSGDEIFKDDIVYIDLGDLRIFYIALCDIKQNNVSPDLDEKCWKELIEIPLTGQPAQEMEIKAPHDARNGVLTQTQINILLADDRNFILFDKEVYRLSDKRMDMGYITYTHIGEDLQNNFYIKVITITLDVRSWVLNSKML